MVTGWDLSRWFLGRCQWPEISVESEVPTIGPYSLVMMMKWKISKMQVLRSKLADLQKSQISIPYLLSRYRGLQNAEFIYHPAHLLFVTSSLEEAIKCTMYMLNNPTTKFPAVTQPDHRPILRKLGWSKICGQQLPEHPDWRNTYICIGEEYYLQTNEQSFILKNITQVELMYKKLMSHLLAVLTRDD